MCLKRKQMSLVSCLEPRSDLSVLNLMYTFLWIYMDVAVELPIIHCAFERCSVTPACAELKGLTVCCLELQTHILFYSCEDHLNESKLGLFHIHFFVKSYFVY